jgi:hypothetical protein
MIQKTISTADEKIASRGDIKNGSQFYAVRSRHAEQLNKNQ